MKALCLAASLTFAAASASAQVYWGWQVKPQTDKLSGRTVQVAQMATATVKREGLRRDKPTALLLVYCDPRQPTVQIAFSHKITSASTLSFGYRTDSGSKKFDAQAMSGHRSIELKGPEANELLKQLSSSSMIYVRTESRGIGVSQAEFATTGAAAPIAAALKDCR
jgi:hypothetical protein